MKPRADSPLKTLPEARQDTIAEYLRDHTLAETRAWLAADGLKTSITALSLFSAWHTTRRQLARNDATVQALLEDLKTSSPDWTPNQIDQAGQAFFTALSIQQQDPRGWASAQAISLKRSELLLAREKFDLLKAQADQATATEKTLDDATLTPADRARRIAEIYGRV